MVCVPVRRDNPRAKAWFVRMYGEIIPELSVQAYKPCSISHIFFSHFLYRWPGRVAQSLWHLTRKSEDLGSIPVWPHTFVSPSAV